MHVNVSLVVGFMNTNETNVAVIVIVALIRSCFDNLINAKDFYCFFGRVSRLISNAACVYFSFD